MRVSWRQDTWLETSQRNALALPPVCQPCSLAGGPLGPPRLSARVPTVRPHLPAPLSTTPHSDLFIRKKFRGVSSSPNLDTRYM